MAALYFLFLAVLFDIWTLVPWHLTCPLVSCYWLSSYLARWEYLAKFNKDTGLYEIDQTGGYGDEANRHKHYVDMYKNYVSKIPLIQEFVAAVR